MDLLLDLLHGLLALIGLERRPDDESSAFAVARTPHEAEALLLRLGERMGFHARVSGQQVIMQGAQDGLPVLLNVSYQIVGGQARFHLNIEVESPTPLLAPWGVYPHDSAPPGSWTLGDPRLDESLKVAGEDAVVVTAVDSLVRDLMLGLAGTLEVRRDRISFRATRAATFLVPLVTQLAGLATRLAVSPEVSAEALLNRFKSEPVAEVRERCLTALLTRFPEAPDTSNGARRGLRDASSRVRLRAAQHLGQEGHFVLRGLVASDRLDQGLRLAAARGLDPFDDDALLAELDRQAKAPEPEVAVPALRILSRFGPIGSLGTLAGLSEDRSRHPWIRDAARQAAARLQARFPSARPGHLSLVEPDPASGRLSLSDADGRLSLDDVDDVE